MPKSEPNSPHSSTSSNFSRKHLKKTPLCALPPQISSLITLLNAKTKETSAISSIIFLLKGLDLDYFEEILEFHGQKLLETLISESEYHFFKQNEVVFVKKQPVSHCFVLLYGKIAGFIEDFNVISKRLRRMVQKTSENSENLNNYAGILRNSKEIAEFSPGEMLAEYAVLSENLEKHSFSAVCKQDSHVICFEKQKYRDIVCKIRVFFNILSKFLK